MGSRSFTIGLGVFSKETYTYDSMSRLRYVDRSEDNRRDAFGYDYSSQMIWATYGGAIPGSAQTQLSGATQNTDDATVDDGTEAVAGDELSADAEAAMIPPADNVVSAGGVATLDGGALPAGSGSEVPLDDTGLGAPVDGSPQLGMTT